MARLPRVGLPGYPQGSDRFKARVEALPGRRIRPAKMGWPRKLLDAPIPVVPRKRPRKMGLHNESQLFRLCGLVVCDRRIS